MLSTTLFAATIGAALAAALPAPDPAPAPPLITAGPLVDLNGFPADCETEACYYTYSECNGDMSFLSQCFTPCGTATEPPPYECPPATATATAAAVPSLVLE